ncbi:hypothetical protein [Catenulispora pinisilvae]|uniref:hypothetical protein n=1 Tax=Catenulispora pinisilvae TaxID=2705253 RepID=UPI00189171AD|nr:hypothetical protein [Catenulispora pinisilvae]
MNAVSGLLTPAQPVLASSQSLDKTKPGLVAFLIVLAIGVALWALLKNMGKQLGRAKDHFEAEDAALAAVEAAAPATVGTAEAVAEVPKQQDGLKKDVLKKDSPKKDGLAKDGMKSEAKAKAKGESAKGPAAE